ncbi:MAG: ATP synthase F0 subunit B [Deltaproteobacteria bacterium]|nr:ATP synthase F0 subunit B [Deltaproteobacteria bacterium]
MHIDHRFVGFVTVLGAALVLAAAAPAAASEPAAAAGEHAAAGHGDAHHPPLRLNWTDFSNRHTAPVVALFVNFVLLLGLLIYFGREPLRQFLLERRRKVQEDVDGAWEEKLRSEGKLQGLETRSRHIDDELKTLRDDLLRIGYDERDRLLTDARARAEKIRGEADAVAREEERRAQVELRRRIVEQALGDARTSLRERLGPADQSRIAEEFLKRLAAQEAQPR